MPTFTGTNAVDTLTGSALADSIVALGGGDRADGGDGNDRVYGGEGGDTLIGGAGDDVLYGFGSGDVAGSGDIRATLISNAFSRQVFATSPPGDPDRLFVVEAHTGRIRILDVATGQVEATPFLDIPDAELGVNGEEGLLGLAFHPQYGTNGRFFVFMNNAAGDIEVRSYLRSAGDPDIADPASGDVILRIPHPNNSNHNGGWMAFGPDGYLYIAVGDGGEGTGSTNTSQDRNVLLGKILRLDVNGDAFPADPDRDYAIPASNPFVGVAGADEIWAMGLRNPWRPSFDRLTGDLYIADVGQGSREEVNFQPSASTGGENYGWKVMEGFLVYDDTIPGNPPPTSPPLTFPLVDYPHINGPEGGFSVTGGYVYRGTSPGLQGVYFFADYVTDQFWTFRVVNGQAVDFANRTSQIVASVGAVDFISSFAEDGRGNLYVLNISGRLYRLDPQIAAGDGADDIRGGEGNDYVFGGPGDDAWLMGDAGADRIYGGDGNDRIDGGADNDIWLAGDAGADTIHGGTGDDRIDGGDGNDTLRGEAGNDTFSAGAGNDAISGGGGNDFVYAGTGDDLAFGDTGDDRLIGEAGNDSLRGGAGNDIVEGGADGDGYLGGEADNDIVRGGAGNDRVDGGTGDDALHGNDDIDYLTGGDGNDQLFGGAGNDSLQGNAGNDILRGETGRDSLTGGAGNDRFDYFTADWADGLFETIFDFSEVAGSNFDTLRLQGLAGNYQFLDGAGFVRVIHIATGGSVYVNGMSAATLADQVVYF